MAEDGPSHQELPAVGRFFVGSEHYRNDALYETDHEAYDPPDFETETTISARRRGEHIKLPIVDILKSL